MQLSDVQTPCFSIGSLCCIEIEKCIVPKGCSILSMQRSMCRQAVMTQLGIKPVNSYKPTIPGVHKDGRRRIENDQEIFQELHRHFSSEATVEDPDAGKISNESLKAKVMLLWSTFLLKARRLHTVDCMEC